MGTEETQTPALSLEDIRGKTPEQLESIVRLCDAHLRALHQNDRGELRDMDNAEEEAFRTLLAVRDAAMVKLEKDREIRNVLARRPKSVETAIHAMGHKDDDPFYDVRRMNVSEARDRALRVLDDKNAAAHLRSDQKDEVERSIRRNTDIARRVLVTENDDYRRAWAKLVTDPHPILTQEEQRAVLAYNEYRAMSEGTTTAGGFGIPVNMMAA